VSAAREEETRTSTLPPDGRWFAPGPAAPEARAQLFCLPHAGGGAAAYRDWQAAVGPEVEVVPARLPGREARFAEPPVTSAAGLVRRLAGPLLQRADRPFALFGHSMGALLAYELAYELVARGRPPVHLLVSGHPAPQLVRQAPGEAVHTLPRPALVRHLRAFQGTADEVLNHPEMLELLLPVIRADYRLCETHRFADRPPLPLPVTALGGAHDPGVRPEEVRAWREGTSDRFAYEILPGGHFYLHARLEDVAGTARAAALGGVPHQDTAHTRSRHTPQRGER
jgi:surfactin synthase thioesterase subunit